MPTRLLKGEPIELADLEVADKGTAFWIDISETIFKENKHEGISYSTIIAVVTQRLNQDMINEEITLEAFQPTYRKIQSKVEDLYNSDNFKIYRIKYEEYEEEKPIVTELYNCTNEEIRLEFKKRKQQAQEQLIRIKQRIKKLQDQHIKIKEEWEL